MSFNIHDIVRLRTNISDIVSIVPDYFRVESVSPDLEIKLVSFMNPPGASEPRKIVGGTVCDLNEGRLFCQLRTPFAQYFGIQKKWMVLVEGLDTDRTRIIMTVPMLVLPPVRFRVHELMSKSLLLFITLKLLRKGFAMCHASSVSKNDRAYVFCAHSGAGKSSVALSLLRLGFEYMAIDRTIIHSSGHVYCYPESQRRRSLLREHLPALKYIVGLSPRDQVGFPIRREASVNTIFILERGKDAITEIDHREAARLLMLLNMDWILDWSSSELSRVVTHYNYFYPELDLQGSLEQYRSCIESFVKSANRCVLARSMSPNFKNIQEILSKTD